MRKSSSPHLGINPVAESAPQDFLPRTKVPKKAQPTFPPRPALWRPNSRRRAKTAAFFLSLFSPILGMGAREEGGGKEKMLGWGGGKKSPSGEKLRNLWRGKKGEGERETSVAEKEAGAAFIITGLDTTFSREGRGRDSTAFPAPLVARTNFSPPSEFSSLLSSPLSPCIP